MGRGRREKHRPSTEINESIVPREANYDEEPEKRGGD